MKKKNLLISASLALGVGVGVFAGIGLHNGVAEVNEVKAEGEFSVYYVGDSNILNNNIYTYGSDGSGKTEAFGAWSGTSIQSLLDSHQATEMTDNGVLRFNNWDNYRIIRIDNIPATEQNLIVNWQGTSQGSDHKISAGFVFGWDWTGDVNIGPAIELLHDVETARNSVRATIDDVPTGYFNYSICGIDPSLCQALYNRYYALPKTAKDYVDGSMTYTYTDETGSKQDNIYYSGIMKELKAIAVKAGLPVSGAKTTVPTIANTNNLPLTITVTAASIALLGTAGFFLLRRRKEN